MVDSQPMIPEPARDCKITARLLLIEDNAPLAEATAKFLRHADLEVRVAESGEEALQAAMTFLPEIVLCDVHLPDMSGLDVMHALRSHPDTKSALLAIYSAMSDVDLRALQLETPSEIVDLFLPKPLSMEKIDRLLAAHASMRQGTSS